MTEKYTGKVAATVIARTKNKEEYLITKREDNGDWEFPGGKQEHGETLKQTAEREIEEELNLNVNSIKTGEKHSYYNGGFEIVPVLAEHSYNNLDNVLEKEDLEDHEDYKWINPEKTESIEQGLEKELNCLKAFDLL